MEYIAVCLAHIRRDVKEIGYAKNSPLGDAMRYYLNGGDDFFTFLKCGDIPIDNNVTEQTCKMFATNRRGFLFCRNDDGTRAASILTTVIKTAEENGLYPDEYLTYVFSHAHNTSASGTIRSFLSGRKGELNLAHHCMNIHARQNGGNEVFSTFFGGSGMTRISFQLTKTVC